jgi:hypothetical protein
VICFLALWIELCFLVCIHDINLCSAYIACHYLILSLHYIKADLLAQYGGVAPKMAEEAHSQVIDQVSDLHNKLPF